MTHHQKKEDRKAQVLEAVAQFLDEEGYPPSFRDLGAATGLAHSQVYGLVKELRSDGLIHERPAQTSRSITLTADGRIALRRIVGGVQVPDSPPD